MKKLVAAVLTGVLVAGTLSTGVYAKDDDKTITVAASATPHAEILEEAKPLLEKEGYDLEVTVFDDYVRPNEVVESGEFDANYFQHIPYLDQFNEEKGTHLVNAGGIHYEQKIASILISEIVNYDIDESKETDEKLHYIPVKKVYAQLVTNNVVSLKHLSKKSTTNEARALLLLQDNGIITLKEGAGLNATVKDIAENPHNVEIVELEAAQVARVTGETAYVVLNGNYALEAGFSVGKDALAYEKSDSEAAKTYVNVIAVKEGNEDSEKIQALVDVLKSDEIKDFINEKYDGAVIPFEESSDAEEADTEDADDADSKDADNADDTAEENADTTDTAEDAE
jgi:D-methionine transport system substrate-binding protein